MARSHLPLTALIVAAGITSLPLAARQPEPAWLELRSPQFTVKYLPGFEQDAAFARDVLNRTEELMAVRYGVKRTGYHVELVLYPEPTKLAFPGRATNECCRGTIDTIHYLAPSAPAWKTATGTTSLGLPYDTDYHAKIITHEYVTMAHEAAQAGRPDGGWRYRSSPNWYQQGLQEYDALSGSTPFNRETALPRVRPVALKSALACCIDGLPQISNDYNGGAAFAWFLAERFGPGVHNRILRSGEPTFARALAAQIAPRTIQEVFEAFRAWLTNPA